MCCGCCGLVLRGVAVLLCGGCASWAGAGEEVGRRQQGHSMTHRLQQVGIAVAHLLHTHRGKSKGTCVSRGASIGVSIMFVWPQWPQRTDVMEWDRSQGPEGEGGQAGGLQAKVVVRIRQARVIQHRGQREEPAGNSRPGAERHVRTKWGGALSPGTWALGAAGPWRRTQASARRSEWSYPSPVMAVLSLTTCALHCTMSRSRDRASAVQPFTSAAARTSAQHDSSVSTSGPTLIAKIIRIVSPRKVMGAHPVPSRQSLSPA